MSNTQLDKQLTCPKVWCSGYSFNGENNVDDKIVILLILTPKLMFLLGVDGW